MGPKVYAAGNDRRDRPGPPPVDLGKLLFLQQVARKDAMYRDFEDLRDNCPAEIRADIAIDFDHPDQAKLREVWPATGDGEFRLALTQAVSDFWDREVRDAGGGRVPEDGFACEMLVDSYRDDDMGATMFLELHAYCGTEEIGDLAWKVFEDDAVERKFAAEMERKVPPMFERASPGAGLTCSVEVTEVAEL
jgi:hypothetical protein